jgi:hypothetical protein
MNYLTHNTALEYFNSINQYGKPVLDNKGSYHIKFCTNIELARAVYTEFKAKSPSLRALLTFHVNKAKTNVIFGGRFPNDSRAKNLIYDLIDKHKAQHGKKLAQ